MKSRLLPRNLCVCLFVPWELYVGVSVKLSYASVGVSVRLLCAFVCLSVNSLCASVGCLSKFVSV